MQKLQNYYRLYAAFCKTNKALKNHSYHKFNSEQEVDKTFEDLRKKGVKIIRNPRKFFWEGYRGYIAGIEDNYWGTNSHIIDNNT